MPPATKDVPRSDEKADAQQRTLQVGEEEDPLADARSTVGARDIAKMRRYIN